MSHPKINCIKTSDYNRRNHEHLQPMMFIQYIIVYSVFSDLTCPDDVKCRLAYHNKGHFYNEVLKVQ